MKNTTPIAVASRSFSRHPTLRNELLLRYSNVTFNETGRTLFGQELIAFLTGHVKAITGLEILDDALFEALPELKVISKYGVGIDMIDLVSMERHGVLLGWTGGVNKRSVAELAVSFMISLMHKVPLASVEVCSGRWSQVRGNQLTGKTVGIVGCGHVGKDVVVLLKPFSCRVLAHDILDFPQFYEAHDVLSIGLEQLITESDIVTLHLPLDDSTRNIIDARRLKMFKRGAYLINTARGGLVEENALKDMLKAHYLGGAALDVFSEEPPRDSELINLSNVIVTPHIGGSTEEAVLAMGRAAIAGLDNVDRPSRAIQNK